MRQDADGIAADADIGGVTEAHHAAITEDQIEAAGGQRQDDDAGEQREQEAVAAKLDINRQQQQRGQQRDDHDIADAEPAGHFWPAENKPSGLTTNTIAISK